MNLLKSAAGSGVEMPGSKVDWPAICPYNPTCGFEGDLITDLTAVKRRPALVVSPDASNRTGPDLVIAFLTSQVHPAPRPGDYRMQAWQEAGLPKPTMLRMKFATVAGSIVIKRLGAVSETDRPAIRDALTTSFGGE